MFMYSQQSSLDCAARSIEAHLDSQAYIHCDYTQTGFVSQIRHHLLPSRSKNTYVEIAGGAGGSGGEKTSLSEQYWHHPHQKS